VQRRRQIGAELVEGGVSFRVWAPAHERLAVVIDGRDYPLDREPGGYFCGVVDAAAAGTAYRFRPGDDEHAYPDPASRFQPQGPHGPSLVVDPKYAWRDGAWRGIPERGRVLYELHIGTFTAAGTYTAASEHLPELADLGVTVIELMPVNEFAGTFGWGYDGVDVWAPFHHYGQPDDLRRFVDDAHAHGIGVILDVVYNHFGPDGCYVTKFTPAYFTKRYGNEWGEAINFDGEDAHGVRELFAENAAYWIDEYHLDGLRIDATQSLNDEGDVHVIRTITERAHAAAGDRRILVVAENEPQDVRLLREYGVDALWNDDWHHAARVALTGEAEAYYSDYQGRPQEFVSMARLGFLYQGQRYEWQKQRRGTPSRDLAPSQLVCYLENHDQVANSGRGERLHRLTAPGRLRAMTALLLLHPQTPMLFQGQELGSSAPFVYFADHTGKLASEVASGRKDFMQQFPSLRGVDFPRPDARATFEMCKLDRTARNAETWAVHRDLLRLRRDLPFSAERNDWLEGAVLGDECFVLRWFAGGAGDRLLVINLGPDLILRPVPEPLLAPPAGCSAWQTLWSSESPSYGGAGTAEVETEDGWRIPGNAAVVLQPASK
jgi:maltooligosyltrehalose trehalohydrolase